MAEPNEQTVPPSPDTEVKRAYLSQVAEMSNRVVKDLAKVEEQVAIEMTEAKQGLRHSRGVGMGTWLVRATAEMAAIRAARDTLVGEYHAYDVTEEQVVYAMRTGASVQSMIREPLASWLYGRD